MGKFAAVILLVAVACALYAWRYGFRPLPPIDPKGIAPNPYSIAWTDLTPDHPWYWVRRLRDLPDLRGNSGNPLDQLAKAYAEEGLGAVPNWAEAMQWIEDHPLLPECFERSRSASDHRPINRLFPDEDTEEVSGWSVWATLAAYPVLLAAEAERRGETPTAFRSLLEGWRLEQSLWPDNVGCNHEYAAVWRRLALTAPLPATSDTTKLLAELGELVDNAPPLEEAFLRQVWERREQRVTKAVHVGPWGSPWQRARHEFRSLFDDVAEFARWLPRRLIGETSEERESLAGLEAMARPLIVTCVATMVSVTRTNDLDHMYNAYAAGVVARLRAGQTNEAVAWAESLRDRRHGAMRWWIDRPLVWGVPAAAGSPEWCLDRIRWGQLSLEACRLTLALRLYRETHGTWPETLAALAPEILPAVPPDPLSGKPFLYRLDTNGYVFASVGHGDHPEGWLLSPRRLAESSTTHHKHVFGSAEPEATSAYRKQRREEAMDVRFLMRYGLLPKGTVIRGTNVALPNGTVMSQPRANVITNTANTADTNALAE
jgi:hypothetical protein